LRGWYQVERALSEMAKSDLLTGALTIRAKNGTAVPNPLVGVGNKAMADVVRYAAEFGMIPPVREAASKRTGSRTAWKSGSRKDRRRPAVSTSRLMKKGF
jgi:phage terminase small subunit